MSFEKNIYGNLLMEVAPQVIDSQGEYERIEGIFADLFKRDRSPDEDKLFDLLANLLEDYERRTLPPLGKSEPVEILKFLMMENDLRQTDLADVFGSQGNVSEVLNGKRGINLHHAKLLAVKFSTSVNLFIK